MTNLADWLNGLRPGDEVMVISGVSQTPIRRQVEKVGKLHVTVWGKKYRRTTGSEAAGANRGAWAIPNQIVPVDETKLAAEAERRERSKLIATIREARFDHVTTDELRDVARIISLRK